MTNLIKIGCLIISLALFSCSNDSLKELTSPDNQTNEVKQPQTKMSKSQAVMYADMLANVNDGEDSTPESRSYTNERSVTDIQYYVQEGDTVIYVFNYGKNQGYLMLGADNSSYPVLAQAKEGRLDLDKIDDNSYLKVFNESRNDHKSF